MLTSLSPIDRMRLYLMEGQALYDAGYAPGVVKRGILAMEEGWQVLGSVSPRECTEEGELGTFHACLEEWRRWRHPRRQAQLTARELERALQTTARFVRWLEERMNTPTRR